MLMTLTPYLCMAAIETTVVTSNTAERVVVVSPVCKGPSFGLQRSHTRTHMTYAGKVMVLREGFCVVPYITVIQKCVS